MHDSQDADRVTPDSVEYAVLFDEEVPHPWQQVVSRGAKVWVVTQDLESSAECRLIRVGLLRSPLLETIEPDTAKVTLRARGNPETKPRGRHRDRAGYPV
jgi:hypothetical protein